MRSRASIAYHSITKAEHDDKSLNNHKYNQNAPLRHYSSA